MGLFDRFRKKKQDDVGHHLDSAIMELREVAHDLRVTQQKMAETVDQLEEKELA